MRPRVLLLFVGIDAAVSVTFAYAWALVWQTCAPPSPTCRAGVCAAICVNAWTQVPSNLVFGALLGLLPVVIAALGVAYVEYSRPKTNLRVVRLLIAALIAATAAGSVLVYL